MAFSQIRLSSFSLQPADIKSAPRSDQAILGTGEEPVNLQPSARARWIESRGWEFWCRYYFGASFSRPFTRYQRGFWEWGWGIQPNTCYRPRVECEPRGVGKSTNTQ